MEVIELGFLIVDIATVGKGVDLAQGGADRAGGYAVESGGAIGLVSIPDEDISAFVHDARYITLDIDGVIVGNAVIGHGLGIAGSVVGQVYGMGLRGSLAVRFNLGRHRHLAQLTAVVHIAVAGGAVGLAGAQAVGIVGVAPGGGAVAHALQLPAMLPGVFPGAVIQGIAVDIIGNGAAVVGRQQVAPGGIPVGVGMAVAGENIARVVVGVIKTPSPLNFCANASSLLSLIFRTIPCIQEANLSFFICIFPFRHSSLYH